MKLISNSPLVNEVIQMLKDYYTAITKLDYIFNLCVTGKFFFSICYNYFLATFGIGTIKYFIVFNVEVFVQLFIISPYEILSFS